MNKDSAIICYPTIRGVFWTILAMIFFGFLACAPFGKPVDKFDFVVFLLIKLFFIVLFLMAVYYLFTIKVIKLNDQNLIIKYPLLITRKEITFDIITKRYTLRQKIRASFGTWTVHTYYEGKRLILELNSNKKIEINSFQTGNFEALLDVLIKDR